MNFMHLPINNNSDINKKKREAEAPILTEEDFVLEYEHLTNTCKPRAPSTFVSWNANGLQKRMEDAYDWAGFLLYIDRTSPDLISIQEVHLAAHPDVGRSFALPGESQTAFEKLQKALSEYNCYASLATTKYAGQIVAVKKKCEMPNVTYNFQVPVDATTPTHDREGRTIILDFPSVRVISRYVPNNGNCDAKKLERRRIDDTEAHDYVEHYTRLLTKPIVYMGDLNVIHKNNDMSANSDYWHAEGFYQREEKDYPKDEADRGFCGTTQNERQRFLNFVKASKLHDPGAVATSTPQSILTWRGAGRYYGEGLRLDYILVSEALEKKLYRRIRCERIWSSKNRFLWL